EGMLQDASGQVREAAGQALASLGWQPADDNQAALHAVALRDWEKAAGLGTVAVAPLVAALQDANPRFGEAAAEALIRIGAGAVPDLLTALAHAQPAVRSYAARVLGLLGDERAVAALRQTVRDPDSVVRESAVLGLWKIGGAGAVEGLIDALQDEDHLVRS